MYIELLTRYLTLRKQLRNDIYFLAHLLNYDKIVRLSTNYHSTALYNRRTYNFTLTEMPRGTYKTTFFTILETIQDILVDPSIRILLCHFSGANARDYLNEIQSHFIINSSLRFAFPDICPANTKRPETGNWTDSSITVKRPQDKLHLKEGTVEALGSEQSLASKHYDKIKFDDLVTEQSSTTVDQIKKSINFLIRSYSLLNNDNTNRNLSITGTEWVPDDAMVQLKNGKVLAPDGRKYSLLRIPAETTQDKTRVPLFPEILSLEVLDGLKKSQRTTYHAFYLLDAEEFEDQVWSKQTIQWHDKLPSDITLRIFGCVDPSISTADIKNNCETAVAIIGLDQKNELWILEYRLGHGVDPIYNWFFELHEKWKNPQVSYKNQDGHLVNKNIGKFRFFAIETVLFQQLIVKELRKQMGEKNKWIPIRECSPRKEKTSRIIGALDPLLSNKAFHAIIGMDELESQIIRFGRPGQRVDLLDAIATGYLEANLLASKKVREDADKEYDEMWANASII